MHPLRNRHPAPDPALVLLRAVCHELRPPVATLTSLVRALEAQPSPERRDELARLAGEHVAHAEAVLSQAAAAAQGLTGPPDDVQPLHRVLPAATLAVPGGRLTVTASPAALAWPVLPRPTRQVLINLLSNAVRHGEPGGPVRLHAYTRRRRLRLAVINHGRMTRDLTESLRRREPPEDEKGLGLWVVRHLLAGCGGTVEARDRGHARLEMQVRLPRRR
jgi:signal transduction histidine kinase